VENVELRLIINEPPIAAVEDFDKWNLFDRHRFIIMSDNRVVRRIFVLNPVDKLRGRSHKKKASGRTCFSAWVLTVTTGLPPVSLLKSTDR
jgi:hypothetical protein